MSTIAKINSAMFELPSPQVVELIDLLDEYRDALMASKRMLQLLDRQDGGSLDQWPGA